MRRSTDRGFRQVVLGVVALTACWLVVAAAPALADSVGSQFRITDQGHDGVASYTAGFADIAYGSQTGQHLVVFVNTEALSDTLEGQFLAADGTLVGSAFAISTSDAPAYAGYPSAVAYDATHDQFLVAWYADTSIFGQVVASDGSLVGSTIAISASTYNNLETVDIAWAPDGDKYLVAWKGGSSDGATFGRLVSYDGTPVGIADLEISQITDGRADNAMAVAYNSVDQEFLVAWSQQLTSTGRYEIFARRLALDGSRLGSSDFQVSQTSGNFAVRPRIAFDAGRDRYLVVFGQDGLDTQPNTEREIFGQFVAADGSLVGTSSLQISDGSWIGEDWGVNGPDVAYDPVGDVYLTVFHASHFGSGYTSDSEVYGDYISGGGTLQGNRDFQVSAMGAPYAGLRPAVDLNSDASEFMTAWHGDTDLGDLVDDQWEIWGRRVSPVPSADNAPPMTTIIPDRPPDGFGGWWSADIGATTTARDGYNGGTGTVAQTRCDVLDATDPAPSFDDLPDAQCAVPTITTEGRHVVWAASIDTAGNKETPVSKELFVDLTNPTLSPTVAPSSMLVLNQTGAAANAGATDSVSGVYQSSCDPVSTSTLGLQSVSCQAADRASNHQYAFASYFVGYKVNVVSPAEAASYKAGKAVPINVNLTDYNGVRATDLSALAATCPVSVAATGDQTLASTCMKYSKRAGQFTLTWRLARNATGTASITVTVNYAGTTATTTKSVPITIVPAR